MCPSAPPRTNDFSLLSPREQAVVEAAVEGFTDEQIAQSLGIAAATVNSYWARIRAKIGSYTRTEIATQFLRREMAERCAVLEAEIEALRARETAIREGEARAEARLERVGDEEWRFLALSHIVASAIVFDASGEVLHANPRARHFFRAARHELEGVRLWDLIVTEDGTNCQRHLEEFFADQENRRRVVGLDEPYFARRCDGSRQRIILSAEWFESPQGVMAVALVREYDEAAAKHFRELHDPSSME